MAKAAAEPRIEKGREPIDWRAAIKDAGFLALFTLGLAFPILAFRTRQDLSKGLVLDPRWELVATFVAIAFFARLGWIVFGGRISDIASSTATRIGEKLAPLGEYKDVFRYGGLALLIAYPFLAVLFTGPAGAL
ncbi:MAG: DUF3382 domain-containing protein, partial [Alphaproteobacteria bacterium]|nr:DUF3382 domain-containing protein [Alphaproteobacteria bacterium]